MSRKRAPMLPGVGQVWVPVHQVNPIRGMVVTALARQGGKEGVLLLPVNSQGARLEWVPIADNKVQGHRWVADSAEEFVDQLEAAPYVALEEPETAYVWAVIYGSGGMGATFKPEDYEIAAERAQQLRGFLVKLPVAADHTGGTQNGAERPAEDPEATTVPAMLGALSWALRSPAERQGKPFAVSKDGLSALVLGPEVSSRINALHKRNELEQGVVDRAVVYVSAHQNDPTLEARYERLKRAVRDLVAAVPEKKEIPE